jgi:serralysin
VVFGQAGGFGANLNLSTLDGTNGFQISGEAANDFSGRSVSSAGDVNGDGFNDLIIGAPDADPNGYSSGASYVVFGQATGLTMAILSGTPGNDTLTGGDLADVILGRDGDDSIVGAGENDFLSGGAGDDNINTGFGDDVVEGGTGNDTVGGMAGRDVVHAGKGDDFIAWNDPVGDVVFGKQGNDVILGGDIAADVIDGGAGDDFIRAFANANAATASDTLLGGRGNDILIGGDAADYIEGGRDVDILSGNDGADVFVFVAAEPGNDAITDFNRQEDVVRLEGFEAGFDPLANLTAGALGTLLDLGAGGSVLFLGIRPNEFLADDFLLVP